MMHHRLPIVFLLACLSASGAAAQEVLRPLKTNPVLTGRWAGPVTAARSSAGLPDTLCLPFRDDFSNPRLRLDSVSAVCADTFCRTNAAIFPTDLLWTDRGAFVNSTYPIDPPTRGVATLDGLRPDGRPYSEGQPYGPADTLTSRPIRLAGVEPSSVFLSFWYQPAGLGDTPDSQDSLLLEFRRADTTWHGVWAVVDTNGATPDPFRVAMIPVIDPAWHYDGFQFRFRNYATRDGNNDHWHIDYVFLDDNRTVDDVVFRDVAFVDPAPSPLKRYRAMPWRQYRDDQDAHRRPELTARVHNTFIEDNNTNFRDSLLETFTGELIAAGPSVSAAVAGPGYESFEYDHPEIDMTVPNYEEDSFSLTWRLRIRPSDDVNPWNDTLLIRHDWYNYYAYDDGSAERAYGLIGTGAKLAMRYETSAPDSVHAVYIHWAYVDGSNADKFFSLILYRSIDTTGATGEDSILYQEDFLTPRYVDSLNGFWIYNLPEPIPVDGVFYVGWLQSQADLLDVGFDRNSDASGQTFYNLGDVWLASSLEGAVMIRPRMGPDYETFPPTAIGDPGPALILAAGELRLWPNPATQRVHLDAGFRYDSYRILDPAGRVVAAGRAPADGAVEVGGLPPGLYAVEVRSSRGRRAAGRLARH